MARAWVHLGTVQLTFLPTSSPKEMDCDCMVQVWPSLRLESNSKVQGVINNPHSIERKMNTEFWSSNTTTCNDLISPEPIFFFYYYSSLFPNSLEEGNVVKCLSLAHTWLDYTLPDYLSLLNIWLDHICMNCTNMIGLSLSIFDDVSYYLRKTVLSQLSSSLSSLLLPMRSLYGFTARAFDVPWISRMRIAWGSPPQGRYYQS